MESNAKEYEQKLESAYNELSRTHLQPLMKKTYQCSANCCDITKGTYEDVHRCVSNCGTPLNQAQTYLKNEFQDFQDRVQRCLMVCNDSTKAKMEKDKVVSFSDKYRHEYEGCAVKCLENHGDQLPSVMQKIRTTLDSHTKNVA